MFTPIKRIRQRNLTLLLGLALLKLVLHLATNHQGLGYGYFRDEFYYWIGAQRLSWGYVDHPLLAPLLLRLNGALLGESIFAMRLLPALAGAARVFLAGLMARELGGGKLAQGLSALAAVLTPIYLIFDGFYSPNAFEMTLWTLAAYLLIRLFKTGDERLWLWLGLALGLSLQFKQTTVLFGLGLTVGLLLTPARRHFRSRYLWLGGLLALLIFLPNLIWQAANGWPSLEFYANATIFKNVPTAPPDVLLTQILVLNPFSLPLWLAGLYFYFFRADGRSYRPLGWLYLTLLLLMMISQSSRPDRIAGTYPMLFAAGGVVWEPILRRGVRWRSKTAVFTGLVLIGGLIMLPLSIPMLPPEPTAQMATAMGISDISAERGKTAALPQYFADRFGWEELAATIAEVYAGLPPEEQEKAVIYATNYGEAGAIDFFGRQYGLPPAISGHNHYYLWGPQGSQGDVVITVNFPAEEIAEQFTQVETAAVHTCTHCMAYEDNLPILIARDLKQPIEAAWPQVKHFD